MIGGDFPNTKTPFNWHLFCAQFQKIDVPPPPLDKMREGNKVSLMVVLTKYEKRKIPKLLLPNYDYNQ